MKRHDITTKTGRAKLTPRREPYFAKLAAGCHLGFRRGPDSWIARYRDRAGQMHYHALGELPAGDEWTEAKRIADKWFGQLSGVAHPTIRKGSVREAIELYVEGLRDAGRDATADKMHALFERSVFGDPLADVSLIDATVADFRLWRGRLKTAQPRRGKRAAYGSHIRDEVLRRIGAGETIRALSREFGIDRTTIGDWKRTQARPLKTLSRQPQSINRIVRQVCAALNAAVAAGFAGNREAWRMARLQEPDNKKKRPELSPSQRASILKASGTELADFLRGLEHTGARPGELARATVSDFNARAGTVRLWSRKGKGEVRERQTILSTAGVAHFKKMAKGKLPAAALFTSPTPEAKGGHWSHHQWANGINSAARTVNEGHSPRDSEYIPPRACAYSFRHSRISELLQVNKLDPVTVSEITGTSLEIIKKHYWHALVDSTRAALDAPAQL